MFRAFFVSFEMHLPRYLDSKLFTHAHARNRNQGSQAIAITSTGASRQRALQIDWQAGVDDHATSARSEKSSKERIILQSDPAPVPSAWLDMLLLQPCSMARFDRQTNASPCRPGQSSFSRNDG